MTLTQIAETEILPLVVKFRPVIEMTEDEFGEFCQLNGDLRIERTAAGDVIIMPPAFSESGGRNFNLTVQLGIWVERDGTGKGFDSSAGFTLPNGAIRAPDASWIKKERWEAIPIEKRRKFAPICPDFVVELKSSSDSLRILKEKMQEYLDNGAVLGWLIDPSQKKVYVYRPDTEIICLDNPQTVSGEPILSGFILDLSKIWD